MAVEYTIKDIADMAGVSVGTVSRVLNNAGNVEPELRRKTLEVIKRAEYRPKSRGRRPSKGKPGQMASGGQKPERSILVFFPGMASEWLSHELWEEGYMRGINIACAERGYSPLIYMDERSAEVKAALSGQSKTVSGALIKTSDTCFASEIANLAKLSPVAVFGYYNSACPVPQAAIDGYGAGIVAAEALLAAGHRRVAFVNQLSRNPMFLDRAQGFALALKREGLFHPELMIEMENVRSSAPSAPLKDVPDMSWALSKLLALKERPTAVAFANDWSALGFYKACEAASLRIPEDFSVIGMDDSAYCRVATPALSSIDLSFVETARLAANMLFDMMEGAGHHLRGHASAHYVPTQAKMRESVLMAKERSIA